MGLRHQKFGNLAPLLGFLGEGHGVGGGAAASPALCFALTSGIQLSEPLSAAPSFVPAGRRRRRPAVAPGAHVDEAGIAQKSPHPCRRRPPRRRCRRSSRRRGSRAYRCRCCRAAGVRMVCGPLSAMSALQRQVFPLLGSRGGSGELDGGSVVIGLRRAGGRERSRQRREAVIVGHARMNSLRLAGTAVASWRIRREARSLGK